MLDPHHTCHFTQTKQTELSLWEDENRIVTVGASPRVLLSALCERDILWFSRISGEFNDDLDIVAATVDGPAPEWLEPRADAGPVARFVGDLCAVKEYVLNDAVAEWAGLIYFTEQLVHRGREIEYEYRETEPKTLPEGIIQLLSCHDECFCNTIPASDAAVRRTISQVLKTHSFYHGRDYDWTGVADAIAGLLYRYKALRLRSHEASRSHSAVTDIGIPRKGWSVHQWREQHKMPHYELAVSVTFDAEAAHLQFRAPGRHG